MVARWTLGISFCVGRDDSARRPITGGSPRGTRRLFEGGFAGFLSEAPPAPPTRRAPPFLPEEMGRKKGRGASPILRWLRIDFHRRRPRRLRPQPPIRGLMAAVRCLWPAKTGRASPPVVGASFRSFASPQAAKLTPSTAPPLPTEPASLGFGGGPIVVVTGAAAPRVARIAVTPQALIVVALYQLGPPGRRRCHASEIPGHLR